MRLPPMVSFVGPSGTGKTTLIERVIVELTHRGFRIAVLKHDAHRLDPAPLPTGFGHDLHDAVGPRRALCQR